MTENIADIITQAHAPTGEMADLSNKARRLGKALEIAERWIDAATSDLEMANRAGAPTGSRPYSWEVLRLAVNLERLWEGGRRDQFKPR